MIIKCFHFVISNELIGEDIEHQQLIISQKEHTQHLSLLMEEHIVTDEKQPSPPKFNQNLMEPLELTAGLEEI